MSGINPGHGPNGDATVLVERRLRASVVFALLVLACAVALFRGVAGAQSTGARSAAAILFGAILVLLNVGAIRWSRTPRRRLEISASSIGYVPPDGRVARGWSFDKQCRSWRGLPR